MRRGKRPYSSHQEREQGNGWRHSQGDPRNRRFDNPIDDKRSSSYEEPRYAEPKADCKIMRVIQTGLLPWKTISIGMGCQILSVFALLK